MRLNVRWKTAIAIEEREENLKVAENFEKCDNTRPCPCTYDCPRHGKCCACVAHHRDHDEGVPGCFFSKEAEALYDRSIEALARDHGILK